MPPHEVAISRTIAATPEEIWAVMTDLAETPARLSSVVGLERMSEGAYAVGTRWRETRAWFGREATQELWVVEANAPWQTVIESEVNGLSYRLRHTLTVSGDHTPSRPRTLVTTRLESDEPDGEFTWIWRVLGILGSRTTQEILAQDLADIAATVEHADAQDMLVVHRLFTRELSAGPDLVRGVPANDRHRAQVVADHLSVVLNTLVDHHHGEDVLIWPLLAQRVDISDDLSQRLADQHDTIHADITEARSLIMRWREAADAELREQLATVLARLSVDVRRHLELEENEILPLIEDHLTRVEYEKLAAHGRESLPKDKAAILVQLFLEGANRQERALLLADYPPAMQLMIRTIGARQYRRYVRQLRTV
ncbi:MAG: hemerythrin domain-containing protein [Propionibacteriaceae bacterium]|nr:hemerythrin domain-containing protein [Propionibacteriaceae bacterium]